ncbi:MAG TPA: hypothetical protein VF177_19475 [Anaerolineae bacterium]
MGFPTWTLVGMGVTGVGALIAIGLAYLAQSPRLLARIGLNGRRWEMQTRALTGYAFSLLLLAFGFFLAGVPLNPPAMAEVTATPAETAALVAGSETGVGLVAAGTVLTATVEITATLPAGVNALTPESGAFGGPPPGSSPADEGTAEPAADTLPATPAPSPTPLPTLTATATATPSPTPTPIEGETAVVSTAGGTLWVRRLPGIEAQTLRLLHNGDIVILRSGHANHGSILWREVSTVNGVAGWVQEESLEYNSE